MMASRVMRLYLASKSPRRRALLRQMGIPFRVLVSNAHENVAVRSPRRFAIQVAERKVMAVAPRVKSGVILGVDTIVVVGPRGGHDPSGRRTRLTGPTGPTPGCPRILGKPASKADARRMLQALSGRTHRVISGVCLLRKPGGRKLLAAETTRVTFRQLSRMEIEDYLSTREPYDKAGAYAIQGRAGFFVERIEGDYFNVVGLPVALILRLLREVGRR
jgi:septum formation protein